MIMKKSELELRIKELELELRNVKSNNAAAKGTSTLASAEGDFRFMTLANHIPAHIAYVNIDTLRYEFVNDLFEKSFGIPKEKIIGSHIIDIIGEPNYKFALKYINEVRLGKSCSYENTFNLTPGKRWVQVNYSPVFDNNNKKVVGIALISYDITERKESEQALKESERKLRQLNADKDRFINILGHDLKSPFNNILGFLALLTEDIRKYDIGEIEDILNKINKSARITNKLLEDILLWARTQQGSIDFQPHELGLEDIFRNVIEVLKPGADSKGIIISCTNEDCIKVFADPDMLKTVILNLVSNAIKFTNRGGEININPEQTDSGLIISVSDNGVGIPTENLAILFDISEVLSTKGTAGETGTGLGLLLCKEFVEKHGGIIWVDSEVGKGSTFKFTLPCNVESKLI